MIAMAYHGETTRRGGEQGPIRTGMPHTSLWAIAASAQPNRVDVLIALRPICVGLDKAQWSCEGVSATIYQGDERG